MSFSRYRRFDPVQAFALIRERAYDGRAPRHCVPVDPWAGADPSCATAFVHVASGWSA